LFAAAVSRFSRRIDGATLEGARDTPRGGVSDAQTLEYLAVIVFVLQNKPENAAAIIPFYRFEIPVVVVFVYSNKVQSAAQSIDCVVDHNKSIAELDI